MKQCLILGACTENLPRDVAALVRNCGYIICADGGIRTASELSLSPDMIVGDFDSWPAGLPVPEESGTEIIRLPKEKDETDTQYAVREGLRRGYRSFVILGGLGGRLDHTLANIATLEGIVDQGGDGLLADGRHRIRIGRGGTVRFDGLAGSVLSIFPQGCEECVVSGEGVQYRLEHLRLKSGFPLGVSNRITGTRCSVTVERGTALFIVCRENAFL